MALAGIALPHGASAAGRTLLRRLLSPDLSLVAEGAPDRAPDGAALHRLLVSVSARVDARTPPVAACRVSGRGYAVPVEPACLEGGWG